MEWTKPGKNMWCRVLNRGMTWKRDFKGCKERRIRQIEGWDVYIAAMYEVTLSPIDFYYSASVNQQPKTVPVGFYACEFCTTVY